MWRFIDRHNESRTRGWCINQLWAMRCCIVPNINTLQGSSWRVAYVADLRCKQAFPQGFGSLCSCVFVTVWWWRGSSEKSRVSLSFSGWGGFLALEQSHVPLHGALQTHVLYLSPGYINNINSSQNQHTIRCLQHCGLRIYPLELCYCLTHPSHSQGDSQSPWMHWGSAAIVLMK